MSREQISEFVRSRLAQGASRGEIETHLRGQKWTDEEIAEILRGAAPGTPDPAPIADQPPPNTPRAWPRWVAALLLLLLAVGGFIAYRHFSSIQAVRALVKNVSFDGNITGRIDGWDRVLELAQFRGALDTADLASPKAAMKLELDAKGKAGKALKRISPATDGRFIAASLMSIAAGGSFFGGADLRFAQENFYFHLDRTPFSGDGQDPLMAIVGALAGSQITANPWVRVPTGSAGTSETTATWGLLFRPTGQVFGSSKELRFVGKEAGEEIAGMPTEIHRYVLDGKWMSKELRRVIKDSIADENMAVVGFIQSLATGKDLKDLASALDTLTCSDGAMKVWVGRDDTLPRRIVIETKLREGRQVPLSISLRGEINATYGKAQTIDFPEKSVTLEELKKSGPFRQFF